MKTIQFSLPDGSWASGPIPEAVGFLERTRGLLCSDPQSTMGMFFRDCRSIHTFGMGYSLDLLFLDEDFRVVQEISNLPPSRICSGERDSCAVLEFPAGKLPEEVDFTGKLLVVEEPSG